MASKLNEIYKVLKQDNRLVSDEGILLKNKVYELAMKMDEQLLKLLKNNKITEEIFFTEIANISVFDKVKFGWLIDSKNFLPDSYTAFKNKIMLIDEKGDSIKNSNNVVLSFPYKDCVLEMDSTTELDERDELFFNECLMKSEIDVLLEPKVLTNIKKYSIDGIKAVNTINKDDNLIIKGNNLLALNSLLPRYENEIKCMYWDILYNTKSDKVPYNDSFKHSSWLTMMKNRLETAYKLLRNDGVILLQCDDNEMAYLKVLCDEIFGRNNCVNVLCVEMSASSGVKRAHKNKMYIKNKEYILLYKKGDIFINPLYDSWQEYDKNYNIIFDGKEMYSLSNKINELNSLYSTVDINKYLYFKDIRQYIIDNRNIIFRRHDASKWAINNVDNGETLYNNPLKKTRNKIVKVYNPSDNKEFELLMQIKKKTGGYGYERLEPISWNFVDGEFKTLRGDLWLDFDKDMGNVGKEGTVKLSNGKKPERLIADILQSVTSKGDIILDAYLGSGTTCAVAHKIGLQYIGIEQLDKHIDLALSRLENVINGDRTGISEKVKWFGGGTFVYCELASNTQYYIDRISIASDEELMNIYKEISSSNFITYKVDSKKILDLEVVNEFAKLSINDKKRILVNIIEKNTLYINYSEIDDKNNGISDDIKSFNYKFYKVEEEVKW